MHSRSSLPAVALLIATACTTTTETNMDQNAETWMQRFSGDWELQSEFLLNMDGSPPGDRYPGEMSARLEGRKITSNWQARYGEATVKAVQEITFEPEQRRFVGTWNDNASEHQWEYVGRLEGDTLVFDAEGPSCFEEGKQAKYRDYYEFNGDDLLVHRSMVLNQDGQWVDYMRNEYRRRRPR